MKKVLALLLAAVMLFSLAACAKTGDDPKGGTSKYEFTTGYDETKYNAPGTLPIFKDKQTIRIMVPDSQYVEDWDTNYETLTLEEDLNADLVINVMPSQEYKTKVNLMVAAGGGELSDAILGKFTDQEVLTYADAGCVLPVTEYYMNKDIAWNIHEGFERLGFDFLNQITMADGEIYGIGKFDDTKSMETPVRFYMYGPWCEQLGIDIDSIHTRDELRDALYRIVTEDPNGNGKADEIGIASSATSKLWFEYLMNSFVYAGDENYMLVEDGKLSFAFTRDEWKEGLKFMRDMCADGIISPLSFSQNSSAFSAMINADETIVASICAAGVGGIRAGDPRRVEYHPPAPLNSDYNGGKPLASFEPNTPYIAMMVTNQSPDPETTFRLGDYMCCLKMAIIARFGEEGVDWVRPQEGDVALFAASGYEPYLKPILVWSTRQNKHWYQTGPLIREDEVVSGQIWTGDPLDHTIVTAEAQAKYRGCGPDEYITKLLYDGDDEVDTMSQYLPGIIDYVDEFSAGVITGTIDIDAEWDNYLQRITSMNAGGVLDVAQTAFDRFEAM